MTISRPPHSMTGDGGPNEKAVPRATSTQSASWSTGAAFGWILAFGALGSAMSEIALILGGRYLAHRYTLLNPQGIWLAPLANAVLLLVPLGLAALVARWRGVQPAVAAMAFVATFAIVFAPLLIVKDRLHVVAMVALAAGVAVQVARFAHSRPLAFGRATRATTMAMLAVALAGALGFNAVRAWHERRNVAALGPAAEGAPNVILLVLDTVRALSLSAYGYERPTSPFLAGLADKGVRFDRAVSTAPWTLPSHATLFTGRYPHELSSGWSTPLDGTYPTLAEQLSKSGYLTVGVAANLHYCSYEFGLSRGFTRYRDYDVSPSEMWRSSVLTRELIRTANAQLGTWYNPGRQSAARIDERLLALLDENRGRPFFAFLNYYDAHATYSPPAPYDTLFLGREPRTRDPGGDLFTAEEVHDLRASYDASIAYLDAELRRLFAELEARELLNNTLVIVVGDHGEEFNEHGQMNHGSSLYFPSVHVPLIVSRPGKIPAGLVVHDPVTIRDVPATILEAAGARRPTPLPGRSLSKWWSQTAESDSAARSPLIAEVDYARNLPLRFAISKGDMRSIVIDGVHYIRAGDGHEEMFDVLGDPWEKADLSRHPTQTERLMAARESVKGLSRKGAARP